MRPLISSRPDLIVRKRFFCAILLAIKRCCWLARRFHLLIYPLSLSLFLLIVATLVRLRGARGKANTLTLMATLWLYVLRNGVGVRQVF